MDGDLVEPITPSFDDCTERIRSIIPATENTYNQMHIYEEAWFCIENLIRYHGDNGLEAALGYLEHPINQVAECSRVALTHYAPDRSTNLLVGRIQKTNGKKNRLFQVLKRDLSSDKPVWLVDRDGRFDFETETFSWPPTRESRREWADSALRVLWDSVAVENAILEIAEHMRTIQPEHHGSWINYIDSRDEDWINLETIEEVSCRPEGLGTKDKDKRLSLVSTWATFSNSIEPVQKLMGILEETIELRARADIYSYKDWDLLFEQVMFALANAANPAGFTHVIDSFLGDHQVLDHYDRVMFRYKNQVSERLINELSQYPPWSDIGIKIREMLEKLDWKPSGYEQFCIQLRQKKAQELEDLAKSDQNAFETFLEKHEEHITLEEKCTIADVLESVATKWAMETMVKRRVSPDRVFEVLKHLDPNLMKSFAFPKEELDWYSAELATLVSIDIDRPNLSACAMQLLSRSLSEDEYCFDKILRVLEVNKFEVSWAHGAMNWEGNYPNMQDGDEEVDALINSKSLYSSCILYKVKTKCWYHKSDLSAWGKYDNEPDQIFFEEQNKRAKKELKRRGFATRNPRDFLLKNPHLAGKKIVLGSYLKRLFS